jgi:hypothetical protein
LVVSVWALHENLTLQKLQITGQNLEVEEEHLKGLTHVLEGVLEGVHGHVEQSLKLLVLIALLQIS